MVRSPHVQTTHQTTRMNAAARGDVSGGQDVGGAVGWQAGGTIEHTYATGSVSASSGSSGGLVATVTGGSQTDTYWDTSSTGQATSAGSSTGLSTNQLTGGDAKTTLSGFDFGSVWQVSGGDYPALEDI